VAVSADGPGLVSQGLARWRAPRGVHDPGKVVADLAAAVALGSGIERGELAGESTAVEYSNRAESGRTSADARSKTKYQNR
jgi:hypothetical protein